MFWNELDVRDERLVHAETLSLEAFDMLAAGECVVIITGHGRQLLTAFQRERNESLRLGRDRGEPVASQGVGASPCSRTRRTIGEFVRADQRCHRTVVSEVQHRADQRLFPAAIRRCAELHTCLERHLLMEEAFLLPTYSFGGSRRRDRPSPSSVPGLGAAWFAAPNGERVQHACAGVLRPLVEVTSVKQVDQVRSFTFRGAVDLAILAPKRWERPLGVVRHRLVR